MANFSKDVIISQLEEPRYEEFRNNVNEWFGSLDCNKQSFNFIYHHRLSKEDFKRHLDEGFVMYTACTKSTNEMIGTIGVERPQFIRGKLTSTLILGAVKNEYQKSGVAYLLLDEMIIVAKQMGAEKVATVTSYYNKFITAALFKKGFTLIETKVEHKSNFTNNMFHFVKDYFVFNYLEKTV